MAGNVADDTVSDTFPYCAPVALSVIVQLYPCGAVSSPLRTGVHVVCPLVKLPTKAFPIGVPVVPQPVTVGFGPASSDGPLEAEQDTPR